MKIGLFGGSFDPPHEGHVLVCRRLQTLLQLDLIWWLVAPQNPLKPAAAMPLSDRLAACRKLAGNHKTYISAEEETLKTQHTADTIKALQKLYPHVRFVWLMGADNLKNFHQWHDWEKIMAALPLAIYPRPNETVKAGLGMAASRYAAARLPIEKAAHLATHKPPAWVLVDGMTSPASSTALRNENENENEK